MLSRKRQSVASDVWYYEVPAGLNFVVYKNLSGVHVFVVPWSMVSASLQRFNRKAKLKIWRKT